ncbi:MAG: hypothetical protein AB1592_19350 [Pseudomonadota bacterium]
MAFEKFEGFTPPVDASEAGARIVDQVSPAVEVEAEPDDTEERVSLRRRLKVGGKPKTEISVSRASAGLVIDIDLGRLETSFEVAVALTGEPPEVLRMLRHDDLDRVVAAVRRALPQRLRGLI